MSFSQPTALPPHVMGVAEPHSHSTASDGMVSPTNLVKVAAAIGLDVICITDHDTMRGCTEAAEAGICYGIEVVPGEEITTSMPPGIHVIALFIDHPIPMGKSLEHTVASIHDQNGLAILAHPFMPTWFASISWRRATKLLEHEPVDGIELRHTNPVLPGTWTALDAFYRRHRDALGSALGASDSHFGLHDIGRLVTAFSGHSAADFRHAIEGGTTSPLRGRKGESPSLRMRLDQQYRSLIWLPRERRSGRIGKGSSA